MARSHTPALLRRAETWIWTGPLGHLVGGSLDLLAAFVHYRRAGVRAGASERGRDARTGRDSPQSR
jgi:hypothetical protein